MLTNPETSQVFPDEFHLSALDVFLDGMCKLKEKVKVRLILQSLVRRLGRYTQVSEADCLYSLTPAGGPSYPSRNCRQIPGRSGKTARLRRCSVTV
jgi:hypothetical protein